MVEALGAPDPETRSRAADVLAATYWQPVYTYLRLRWRAPPEEAEDLTQEFFGRALERGFFVRYDPGRARFRTFVRVCVDRLVANERQAAGRLKRGGGMRTIPLDLAAVERELATRAAIEPAEVDEFFRREVVRAIFTHAIENLRSEAAAAGKRVQFTVFERYDLEGPDRPDRPSYATLALELGIPVTQVTNHLAAMRRRFRALVLERLRSLAGSDTEYRAEAREILGIDPP